jgi:hypothetical protein
MHSRIAALFLAPALFLSPPSFPGGVQNRADVRGYASDDQSPPGTQDITDSTNLAKGVMEQAYILRANNATDRGDFAEAMRILEGGASGHSDDVMRSWGNEPPPSLRNTGSTTHTALPTP